LRICWLRSHVREYARRRRHLQSLTRGRPAL
jgi:hypothetical protein